MAKSPTMTAAELIRLLKQHGYEFVRAKGSHQVFKNSVNGKMTVVPMHRGDIPKGTLNSILRHTGLDKADQ
ncbi:MAG TPA: type II toxin-antitoxin system HicA family toxin [Flavobacteriales bacterium]|nr:type II toxin-antitoxin system HicA family toxin [Flavobacteriales bacterium]